MLSVLLSKPRFKDNRKFILLFNSSKDTMKCVVEAFGRDRSAIIIEDDKEMQKRPARTHACASIHTIIGVN